MNKCIEKEIKSILDKLDCNNVYVYLSGFLKSKFFISGLKYKLEYDILKLNDKDKNIYLSINLNQVYKCEILENGLEMYLDNDITVKLIEE